MAPPPAAWRQLQESILDVITMVAGTIPTQMRDVRMEFWRCVNLHHLCTYVLADKQRAKRLKKNMVRWRKAGRRLGLAALFGSRGLEEARAHRALLYAVGLLAWERALPPNDARAQGARLGCPRPSSRVH